MAYKPKNVAKLYDDSKPYPQGTGNGRGPGTVPGTSGSNDRDSQRPDFFTQGQVRQDNPDFKMFNETDETDSRKNPNHGKASYDYQKPTL